MAADAIPNIEIDDSLRESVLCELKARISLFQPLDSYMCDLYINAVVYPMIGLNWESNKANSVDAKSSAAD